MAFSQVFQTAVNAILPIVLLILLGYGLRQRGFLTEAFLKNGNRLTFRVLLPVTLFINVYNIESLIGSIGPWSSTAWAWSLCCSCWVR